MNTVNVFSTLGLAALFIAGCHHNPSSTDLGGRELRPPRAGIEVGSLYYVREKPTNNSTKPANLERLCDFDLSVFGVEPKAAQQVADIDLLKKFELDGGLDGIKTKAVSIGLNGNLSRYYTYKLTNVTQTDISFSEAGEVFDGSAYRKRCNKWRTNIAENGWAAYQIQTVKIGDVVFEIKNEAGLSGNVKAKLKAIEPELKATLKNKYEAKFAGKQLVVSFSPINRS